MRYLDNLRSVGTRAGLPWEFEGSIPPGVDTDKEKRTAWITDPSTKHCVYSAWEGVNAAQRITEAKGALEGNPPAVLHGLVADFDAPLSRAEIEKGMKRLTIRPNWISTSLSGNVHAVWLFESPLQVPGHDWAVAYLKHVMGELKLKMFARPGSTKRPSSPRTAITRIRSIGARSTVRRYPAR